MATARYTCEWKTLYGDEYRMVINDADYDSSENELEIGFNTNDGFKLNYTPEMEERFAYIIGSNVTLQIVINSSAQETLIDDIIGAQEERFALIIYKKISAAWELFWFGQIINDAIVKDDLAYPYNFEIKASDSFGRLKGIDYDNAGTVYSGRETFIEHLTKILTKAGFESIFDTADIFLKTAVDWYEGQMFVISPAATLDPVAQSSVYHECFITLENNVATPMSCYDVLWQICARFNARILLSNGIYHFISINNYENATLETRDYNKLGTNIPRTGSIPAAEDFKVSAYDRSGKWNYFPALRQVEVPYKYRGSINSKNLLPDIIEYTTLYTLSSAPGGSGESLVFSGIIQGKYVVGDSEDAKIIQSVFQIKLRVGIYYLTNKNGYDEWTTTSTDTYEKRSVKINILPGQKIRVLSSVGFITPPIPASGIAYFQIDFEKYVYFLTDITATLTDTTVTRSNKEFQLMVNLDDPSEGILLFGIINTSNGTLTVKSSAKILLPELLTGDGPETYSLGRVVVYAAASSSWINSDEDWTIGGTGTGININKLLIQEILSGQKYAAPIYRGTIIGEISAVNQLVYYDYPNYVYYIMMEATFNANLREWQGSWFKVYINNINLLQKEVVDPIPAFGGPLSQAPIGINHNNTITELKRLHYINNQSGLTQTTSIISSGATTSIPITDIGATILSKNDKIKLIEVDTNTTHTLTINADQKSGNTSLTISSYSFPNDIQIGALIFLSNTQVKIQQLYPEVINWPAKTSIQTANYTVENGVTVIYGNPSARSFNIKLPVYANSGKRIILIINIDVSNTLTVERENIEDKINGVAADFTLATDSVTIIHNTEIATIGWATILKTTRK